MLYINDRDLDAPIFETLSKMQKMIDIEPTYLGKVNLAKLLWETGRRTNTRKVAFKKVRELLSTMCVGATRCAYCEDSAADEVEHIYPKSIFPERTFLWSNYLFACGPCNGPKSSRFGVLQGKEVFEFVREPKGPVIPPPPGINALIDPRVDDPTLFLELDLGGTTHDGTIIHPTFIFLARDGISEQEAARAEFSIEVLDLNREVVRKARENAFSGFRARLCEYADKKSSGKSERQLDRLRKEILSTPHLTVFYEMRRQRNRLPDINKFINLADEIIGWDIAVV